MKYLRNKFLVCIDNTEHSRKAVHFACNKARKQNYSVELLHVIDSSEYNTNSLFGVSNKIRDERWKDAQWLINEFSAEAQRYASITPSCILKEGMLSEEVVKVVENDPAFNMLIIGKAPHQAKKNDMISMLVAELAGKIMIPMIIVPGNLTNIQIDELV